MTNSQAFDYVRLVLEKDFFAAYMRFVRFGLLHYELTNIIELCSPLMTGLTADDQFLRLEVKSTIANYLLEY